MTHRIFIVEDHPLMLQVTGEFIDALPGLTVSGTAASAEDALDKLGQDDTDLVLADVSLPGMSGIDLVGALHERRPGLRCLMFSAHYEGSYVERALAAGAQGYVVKGNPSELEDALRSVLSGEGYLSPSVRERLKRNSA